MWCMYSFSVYEWLQCVALHTTVTSCSLQNYGDESDAYGLMYPSLYSNSGVYESDFFEPRSEAEVRMAH